MGVSYVFVYPDELALTSHCSKVKLCVFALRADSLKQNCSNAGLLV